MAISTPASKYGTRVTIKKPTRVKNGANEDVPTYRDAYCPPLWASLVPSSAREFIAANQVNGMIAAIVRVRSNPVTRAITSDMRMEIRGRVLNIGGVFDESDSRREVVLWCTEVES